jgi:peptide/nickel transport system substrate-binding protein
MSNKSIRHVMLTAVSIIALLSLVLAGCAAPTPEVIEKEVIVEKQVPVTVEVEKEKVVEKEVPVTIEVEKEKVVEKEVTKEVVVTPTPLPPPPKKGGTFVTTISGDPVSLNGIVGNDGSSLNVICLNQNPLTLGGENWGSIIAGDLAESWEVSEDGKVWTFHLRKDVKWHDGQPCTADDVLFTFQAIQNPEVQTGFRGRFMEEGEPIKFEKVDDYTIRATLKEPIAPFVTNITVPIIPKHILEGQDINISEFNEKPIGTGPFKVVEWRSGESVTLEDNPDFYRGEPYLDRWVIRIIPSTDARIVALQTGEVDFGSIRGKDVPKFLDKPEFTITTQAQDNSRHIGLNNARPFFQDKRVRQALMYALDRQAIVDAAEQGYGIVCDSPFNQPVFIYQEGDLAQYEFNLDKAKELLKEAGWEDTDGDGIVDKDGEPFKITLNHWTGFMADVAPLIQAWWGEIGIDVTIQAIDPATYVEQIYTTTEIEKPYDALLTGWGLYGPDPDHYAANYAPEEQGESFFNYYNEDVKALFDKGRVTIDEKERKRIYEEAERELWEELPILPLYYPVTIYVINNRVNIDEAVLDSNRIPSFRYPEKIYIQEK